MSGTGAAIDTRALEAVLFVSDEPLTPAVLSQALHPAWRNRIAPPHGSQLVW